MLRTLKLSFLLATLSLYLFALPSPKPGFDWNALHALAIQNRGRIKPMDTFAREASQFVTGKVKWNGFDPTELVFSWLITFEPQWQKTPFIRVDYGPLKKSLGLEMESSYFSPERLRENKELRRLVMEGQKKNQAREKPNDLEKKAGEVFQKLALVEAIVRGEELSFLPNPEGMDRDWVSLAALTNPNQIRLPYKSAEGAEIAGFLKTLLTAYTAGDSKIWNKTAPELTQFIRNDLSGGFYPTKAELGREIHYNTLRPFRWAWILYALSFALLLSSIIGRSKILERAGLLSLACAFGMHVYGFVLRCWISGRPPVSNMYESVIWVSFGCILFSLIIFLIYKNVVIPTAATVFAIIALVLADNLPSVLDPGIHPLEPVLRSNFWLTIHVLTITLSYAAFALSLCLGNVVLGHFLFGSKNSNRVKQLTLYMYRAVQMGVILLASGTILGGVWADYSWGRFWGWDPKEVWALIALLLYLAVLHGRYAGWLKDVGFPAATVLCFLGVLMAWYGVNFVLGVGLHSYGFGSGGIAYVLAYTLLQVGFIIAAAAKARG